MSRVSQQKKLIKALMRKKGVTSLEAFGDMAITSMHSRLTELRHMGVKYIKKPFTTSEGVRFLRYHAAHVPAHLVSWANRPSADAFMDGLSDLVRGVSRKARG
jgi:hypothetical protein